MHQLLDASTRLQAANNWGSPSGIIKQDHQILFLWNLTYWMAIPLGGLVIALILWCAVRYRRRRNDDRIPSQFQYHVPLEALYTIVPIMMVIVVFIFTYRAENTVNAVSKTPDLVVRVDGFQWGWHFSYPNNYQVIGDAATEPDINAEALPVLTLPAGETVQLNLYSDDVNHSFYVPAFLVKRDLIQGINNTIDVNIDPSKVGKYPGECTQYCGTYHSLMRFTVDVMPAQQFNSWLAAHAGQTTIIGGGTK